MESYFFEVLLTIHTQEHGKEAGERGRGRGTESSEEEDIDPTIGTRSTECTRM